MYSTCTINPQENEEVICYALRTYEGVLSLEPPEAPGLVLGEPGWAKCGLSESERRLVQRFDPSTPSGKGSIGFFVARLRKRHER